jgi:hypothetical protein
MLNFGNYSGPWERGDLNSPPWMRGVAETKSKTGWSRKAAGWQSRADSNHPCRGPEPDPGIPSLSKEGSPLPMIVHNQKGPE